MQIHFVNDGLLTCKIAGLLTGKLQYVETLATTVQQVMLAQNITGDDDVTKQALDAVNKDIKDPVAVIEGFGKNCHLPGSYQGALFSFISNKDTSERFAKTIRSVIQGGGCNCSRANYAGALIGAQDGMQSLPTEWIMKVTDIAGILKQILRAIKI